MRIIGYIFTALLAIAAMCSCTHNNGDIGPLFGQWKITDIATTDAATGTVTHNATSGAFLSFQNDVVTLTQVYDGQHLSALSYGQWELNGNSLTLYFDISDGVSLPGAMFYPRADFNIETLSGSELVMTLAGNLPEGAAQVCYTLKKWN